MNQTKQAVADCMNRLYARHLTTLSGGNVSTRGEDDLIQITPSGTDKGHMSGDQIAAVGLDGKNHTPSLKPSSELPMHLSIYQRYPDVRAIAHAHPAMASVFTVIDRPLNTSLLEEAYLVIGASASADYARTGTQTLADAVTSALGEGASCVLMRNHGVLAIGDTLLQAFNRIEVLEQLAKVTFFANVLGGGQGLTAKQCAALDRSMGR